MSPVRFELAAFRSGVERATIAPQAQIELILSLHYYMIAYNIIGKITTR